MLMGPASDGGGNGGGQTLTFGLGQTVSRHFGKIQRYGSLLQVRYDKARRRGE